jgi:gliding motility-associated-like protein
MNRKLLLLILLFFAGAMVKAQLVINEFSQGVGTSEYIEIVVVGTKTCTDSTADLRGWIVDDNSGWYGTGGIASGHIRFPYMPNWQAVPYGSVILLYNGVSKNASITQADDNTDANQDHVYIVPVETTNNFIESSATTPTSGTGSPTYVYPTTGYSSANNDYTARLSLANGGDAVILVKPNNLTTAYHSVNYQVLTGTANQTPTVQLVAVGSGANAYLTNANYNIATSWAIGSVPTNETPGAGNTTANIAWITGMRTPATSIPPSTISASICSGDSYLFGGTPRTAAGTYTYVFTGASGCDSAVTLNLTVNPRPLILNPFVSNPSCAGNNGSITINGLGTSINYTVSYSFNTSPVTGLSLTANAAGQLVIPNLSAGNYTNIIVSSGGCVSTPFAGPLVLTNTPGPAQPSAASNTPVCAGQTLNLTTPTVAGATYSWNGPNGFTSTLQNPTITNVPAAANGTYSVTVTVNGCTSTAGTTAVVINPRPATPTASTTPACENETLGLLATNISGGTYSWTGPGGYTSNVQNPTRANSTLAMSGYYKVTVTVAGCTSLADSVNVAIKPRPATPAPFSNSPVCIGDTVRLNATGITAGAAYSWAGPFGYVANGLTQNFVATSNSAGLYFIVATLNGCASTTAASTNVQTTARPVITSAVPVSPTSCGGTNGSITLSGLTANTTFTITYLNNSTPVTTTITSNGAGSAVITGLAAGTYSNIIASAGSCSSAPFGPVTISSLLAPAAPGATASPAEVCEGGTIQLNAGVVTNGTYQWSGPGGFSSTQRNPQLTSATIAASGTYSVTVTVNGCTSAASTVAVTINSRPAAPSITSNSPICSADTLKIFASNIPGATYNWSGPGSYTSTVRNPVIANPTGANTGTYTVTATVAGCTSLTSSIFISVNSRPATPTITNNSTSACSGGTISLVGNTSNATTYNWTGPNGFTATTNTVSIPNATTANSGVYTFTVSQNGCTSLPATVNVIINTSPTIASAVGTNPIGCGTASGSIALTGLTPNTTYTVNYTIGATPVTITVTANASGVATISGLSGGTYSNIIAQLGPCVSNVVGPITLVQQAVPAAPTAGNNGPYCSGATLLLTSTTVAGATYSWVGPNGFTSNIQNPSIPNVSTNAAGTYSVTVTIGGCSSPAGTTDVVINPSPTAPVAGSNSAVCIGNTLLLTATSTAGATYSWSGPNSFTSSVQNPSIPGVTTAMAGTYTVTATLGACTSQPVSTTVSVVTAPGTPVPVTPVVYCQDAIALPLTATGTNLVYYTTATGGTGVASLIPSTAAAGTFNYYVAQSSNGCEGPRAQIVVTVNPKPTAPATDTLITYCQFSIPTQLTATGTNIRWYATLTDNTPLSTAPTPNTQVAGSFYFYVSQQAGLCESDRVRVTVDVNAKPAPPIVQTPTRLCQYDTVALTADGINLLWYQNPVGGAGNPRLVPNAGIEDTFFYYVTQTIGGCESDRSRTEVIVDYKPNGIIRASRPWICAGDTISFLYFGNARAGAEYNWKSPQPGSRAVSGGGQGPYVVQYDSSGSQYIQLTVNNNGCLSDVIEIPVEVRPRPRLDFVVKPEACVNEAVTVALSGITSGINRFDWNFDNGKVLYSTATGGPYGLQWSGAGIKVISVTATSAACGSFVYRDTVVVHPNPDAGISRVGNGTLCAGDSVELQVVNLPGSTYSWTPAQFFPNRAKMASTVYATPNTSGFVHVQITSAQTCTSKDSIYIDMKPCCEVYFPNAFSPNGDNKNDVFRPVTVGHHEIATFRIVNRWGQVVYETRDERRGWDGNFNGRPQDVGNYYYYFKFKCNGLGDYTEQKGEFTLMR